MKATKDCEWEVEICHTQPYWWRAWVGGIDCGEYLEWSKSYKSKQSARRSWLLFAKINRISKENWRWV